MTHDKNCKNEETPEAEESQLIKALRRHIADSPQAAAQFSKLYQDIMLIDQLPEETTAQAIDCQTCQDWIALRVAETNPQTAPPLIRQHLQECDRCQLIFETTRQLLAADDAPPAEPGLYHAVRDQLFFLKSQPENAPWHTRLRSRLTGAPFSLTFQFNLDYLRTLLTPPAQASVRAAKPAYRSKPGLLLNQPVQVGDQTLTVEVTCAASPAHPEHLTLQGVLLGRLPSTEQVWGTLVWARQTCSAPVSAEGRIDFGEVSLTALKEAITSGEGTFEIAFEVRPPQ